MTIESRYVHMAYLNFIQEIEMVSVKLLRSDFKIRKPFDNLRELLNSSELLQTNSVLTQKVRFIDWCVKYTENVFDEVQRVNEDAKIVERDDYWEVFLPHQIANVRQNEVFDKMAHICGNSMWDSVHFGELGSPLEFEEFINHFTEDDWEKLYNQLERCADRTFEDMSSEIDDVLLVCNKLDLLGESEKTLEDCASYVFSE